jgi:signal transduction histidine kinase
MAIQELLDRENGGRARDRTSRPAPTRSIGVTLLTLLVVPVVALTALWAFLAVITLGSAVAEVHYNREVNVDARATTTLLAALEQERLQTFLWLSTPRRPPVSQLAPVRRADDAAIRAYERTGAQAGQPAQQTLASELRQVPGIRAAVGSGALTPTAAFQGYSSVVDALFGVYISSGPSDAALYRQTLGAIDAGRALEQLTGEATLAAGALTDGGELSASNRALFAGAVASQRLFVGDALAESTGHNHADLARLYGSAAYARFAALENQISGTTASHQPLPLTLREWLSAVPPFLGQFVVVTKADSGELAALSGQTGRRLILEAGLAGGLGLLGVALSLIIMVRISRGIRRELIGLHDGAAAMASAGLPRIIERLRDGDDVDVDAESPPLPAGRITEIAQVANAFSIVQHTAVDAAVGQASLRKGINQVFLNISLRSQSLLHRQLSMFDAMERATTDPAALAELFRLDQLTTRMRRHAEGLIILSGAAPARGWRDPVPVLDVLRAAIAEVEDFARVDVAGDPPGSVLGGAVNDVVHLLAELIENAVSFSPPTTSVVVRADVVGVGVAVEVEDRGMGMSAAELADINARLASPPELDLASIERIGLYVASRLAARHGIGVRLQDSPYGGTTAIVLLPHSVIAADAAPGAVREPAARPGPALAGGPVPVPVLAPAPGPSQVPAPGPAADPATGLYGRHRSHRGLPARVRQASLAPGLREPAGPARMAGRSPEEARRVMAEMRDGWQRGRTDDLDDDGWPDPATGAGGRAGQE